MPMKFEQQSRESHKAFAAFKTYLELGPERSLATVAQRVGKSKTMVERWSRRLDWPARVEAHAAHLADAERKAIEGLAVERAVEWDRVHEAVTLVAIEVNTAKVVTWWTEQFAFTRERFADALLDLVRRF